MGGVPTFVFSSGHGDVISQVRIIGEKGKMEKIILMVFIICFSGIFALFPAVGSHYPSHSHSLHHNQIFFFLVSFLFSFCYSYFIFYFNSLLLFSFFIFILIFHFYFIFFSQAFLQGGLGGDSGPRSGTGPPTGAQILPQNLRIISNFFRTAPDGSVRAFSQPIVHER